MLLDGDWESVQGELESASVSCPDFLPEECFQGVVDLFGYTEPAPSCEWLNAKASLRFLGDQLDSETLNILRGLSGMQREEVELSLLAVTEKLRKAARLFEPGGFYMPIDPRDPVVRAGRGFAREPERRPFGWGWDPEETRKESAQRAKAEAHLVEAVAAAQAAGEAAVLLLARVGEHLEAAEERKERRALLRKLVLELHPDQNPQREQEVMPTFRYVQQLRDGDK